MCTCGGACPDCSGAREAIMTPETGFEAVPIPLTNEEVLALRALEGEAAQEVPTLRKVGPTVLRAVSAAARRARPGMPPEKVCWVQTILNQAEGEALATDGVAGALTRAAVQRFQQRYGLTVDGVVGPQTGTALTQTGLNRIAQASLVPVDGVPDARTRQEIVRFQSSNGLAADGIVGPATRAAMVTRLGGRCLIRTYSGRIQPPPPNGCACGAGALDEARRRCRSMLYANIKACVFGERIIYQQVPHAADQIAGQVVANATAAIQLGAIVGIILRILQVVGAVITIARIWSIAKCIHGHVGTYHACLADIDRCEQQCRARGML